MVFVFVITVLMENIVNLGLVKMTVMEKEIAKTEIVYVKKAIEELIALKDM
jgi:hypothetical protein